MRRPKWLPAALCFAVVLLLDAPALLGFWTHVLEHTWPLGFSRDAPPQAWQLPPWWSRALVWSASMRGMDAIARSCWGEAPHIFGY